MSVKIRSQVFPTKIEKSSFPTNLPKIGFSPKLKITRQNILKKNIFSTKTGKSHFSSKPKKWQFLIKPKNHIFFKDRNLVFRQNRKIAISRQNGKISFFVKIVISHHIRKSCFPVNVEMIVSSYEIVFSHQNQKTYFVRKNEKSRISAKTVNCFFHPKPKKLCFLNNQKLHFPPKP